MTTRNERTIVNVVNPVCCGMDVHKKTISACILFTDHDGKESTVIREFGAFTDDLTPFRGIMNVEIVQYNKKSWDIGKKQVDNL